MCCSFIVSYIWKMHGFDFIQFVCPVLLHALFYELKTILRNLLHLNPKQDKYCVNWTSSYVPRSQEEPVTTKALNKLITVWTQHQIKSECLESFNHLDKCQYKTTIEIRYKLYFYIYIYMYVYISWKWCTQYFSMIEKHIHWRLINTMLWNASTFVPIYRWNMVCQFDNLNVNNNCIYIFDIPVFIWQIMNLNRNGGPLFPDGIIRLQFDINFH